MWGLCSSPGAAQPRRDSISKPSHSGLGRLSPFAERSRFAAKIAGDQFVTSVEIVPPKGCDPSRMIEGVRELKDAGVDAVVTTCGKKPKRRLTDE